MTGPNHTHYDYPLADVSRLSEKEKKDLLKRGMRIPKELIPLKKKHFLYPVGVKFPRFSFTFETCHAGQNDKIKIR